MQIQFTYINLAFSPAPDDTVSNLYKVNCVPYSHSAHRPLMIVESPLPRTDIWLWTTGGVDLAWSLDGFYIYVRYRSTTAAWGWGTSESSQFGMFSIVTGRWNKKNWILVSRASGRNKCWSYVVTRTEFNFNRKIGYPKGHSAQIFEVQGPSRFPVRLYNVPSL